MFYVFYHQRLRDAAREAMEPALQRRRHREFAAWLESTGGEPGLLAYHWTEAGCPERAVAYARSAADAARDQLSWSVAADWDARALDLDGCTTGRR